MAVFFADSYAIIDYLKGNRAFAKLLEKHDFFTTRLNLMEVYYSVLSLQNIEHAEAAFVSFLPKCVEFSDETIKRAMRFKLKEKARKLSYIDAIGYQLSLERNAKFLTGDRQFKEMPNVEFVK